jgi:membrane protease YdiL (CAAX protease family)
MPPSNTTVVDSRGLEAALLLLALFFFASSGASYLLPGGSEAGVWRWLVAVFVPLLLLLAGSLSLIRRFSIPLSSSGRRVWLTVSIGATLGAAGGLSVGGTSPAALAPGLGPAAQCVYAFLWVGMAGPIIEELFFRGTLQPLLLRHLDSGPSVAIPAVLFMAAHIGLGGLWLFFLLGLGFGMIAYYSRSVWPAAAAHIAWNTGSIAVGIYPAAADWAPWALGVGAMAVLTVWACLDTWGKRQ